MSEKKPMSVKLLVDRSSHKVLFAEAGKGFVDLLFSLLGLPLGSAFRLPTDKSSIDVSISKLCHSVDNLCEAYIRSGLTKTSLLNLVTPSLSTTTSSQTPPLLLQSSSSDAKTGQPSKPRDPYRNFEEQEAIWECKEWTQKEWKYRAIPPPDKIPVTFEAVISDETHLCEECGYSTSVGYGEKDVFFVSKEYNIHLHKTCFLIVLDNNRGRKARNNAIQMLGQYWQEIEENRILQTQKRKAQSLPTPLLPELRCYVSDVKGSACPLSSQGMVYEVGYVAPPSADGKGVGSMEEKGFVKGGTVTYMVTDDLEVMPMSAITLLTKFNVRDVGALEEKVVEVGMEEVLSLLKASLQSKTALTDTFLK